MHLGSLVHSSGSRLTLELTHASDLLLLTWLLTNLLEATSLEVHVEVGLRLAWLVASLHHARSAELLGVAHLALHAALLLSQQVLELSLLGVGL